MRDSLPCTIMWSAAAVAGVATIGLMAFNYLSRPVSIASSPPPSSDMRAIRALAAQNNAGNNAGNVTATGLALVHALAVSQQLAPTAEEPAAKKPPAQKPNNLE